MTTWPQPEESDRDAFLATESWFADIAWPADASSVSPWSDYDGTGTYSRTFSVSTMEIEFPDGTATVEVTGIQTQDGACTRTVVVDDLPIEFTAAQAQVIAAALVAAAKRIDSACQ